MKLKKAIRCPRSEKGEDSFKTVLTFRDAKKSLKLGGDFASYDFIFRDNIDSNEAFLYKVLSNANFCNGVFVFEESMDKIYTVFGARVRDVSRFLNHHIFVEELLNMKICGEANFLPLITRIFVEEGKLKVFLNNSVRPFVLNSGDIVLMPLELGVSLYTIRLSNYIKEALPAKRVEMNLKALHKVLDLPVTYVKHYSELKRRVLNRAVSDINLSEEYTIDDFGKYIENGKYSGVWFSITDRR